MLSLRELSSSNFKPDGLTVIDSSNKALRFLKDINADGSAGAYYLIEAPKQLIKNQQYTLIARLQLKNETAKIIRVRLESGGKINNAWIDFNDLNQSSNCDSGLSVWFVKQDTVLVDVNLNNLLNDNVRFSLHIVDGDMKLGQPSFMLEKFSYDLAVGKPINDRFTFHSIQHAGKAPELCKGIGIEIGALHKPLPLDACVIHLDRFSTEELKRNYANDNSVPNSQICQVQVVCKEGFYPFLDDNAFDFVVNSHVVEHVCNPGRQIEEWLRIIKPGGILYMIIPDKNFCFDRKRATTSVQHLIEEFEDNIQEVTIDHYYDYMVNTSGEHGHHYDLSEDSIRKRYQAQTSIHVHTFDPDSLKGFIEQLTIRMDMEPVHYEFQGLNMHCALRKK